MKGRKTESYEDEEEEAWEKYGSSLVDKPLMTKDTRSGAMVPIELLDPQHSISPSEAINDIVRDVLKQSGWKVDQVLFPKHFLRFIVAHMLHFSDSNTLWRRLFGKRVPKNVMMNPIWQDLIGPSSSARFTPEFWKILFKDFWCNISPQIVQLSRYLAFHVDMAHLHGVNVTGKNIFMIFMLKLLAGRNAAEIAAHPLVVKMMYKRSKYMGQSALERMEAFCGKLFTTHWSTPQEEENGLVMLLCSSTFRGFPFIRRCYREGTIPVIQISRSIRAQQTCIGSECCDSDLTSGDSTTTTTGVGCGCGPHETEKKKKEAAAAASPAEPVYLPYPGSEETHQLLKQFNMHTEPLSEKQEVICSLIASKDQGEFAKIMIEYAKLMGFSQTVDTWEIVKSAYVALLGGKHWLESHKIIVPDHVQEKGAESKYEAARNVLSKLTLPMVVNLIEAIDTTRVKTLPSEVATVQMALASHLGDPLSLIPKQANRWSELVKMVLSAYWIPGNTSYNNVDLWKALQFSMSNRVEKAIAQMIAEEHELPSIIRALVMASITASTCSIKCKSGKY